MYLSSLVSYIEVLWRSKIIYLIENIRYTFSDFLPQIFLGLLLNTVPSTKNRFKVQGQKSSTPLLLYPYFKFYPLCDVFIIQFENVFRWLAPAEII